MRIQHQNFSANESMAVSIASDIGMTNLSKSLSSFPLLALGKIHLHAKGGTMRSADLFKSYIGNCIR